MCLKRVRKSHYMRNLANPLTVSDSLNGRLEIGLQIPLAAIFCMISSLLRPRAECNASYKATWAFIS